jgi:hypothetical protein
MPLWRCRQGENQPEQPKKPSGQPEQPTEQRAPYIRDAEVRSLRRLLQRRRDLEFDIEQALSAHQPVNRWTERVDQLNAAITQAQADLAAATPKHSGRPPLSLDETPIETVEVSPAERATVILRTGEHLLEYQEELDWAERGHQMALPQIYRIKGDVVALLPEPLEADERTRLVEHLRHSFATLANEVLERTIDDEPIRELTLADLARPCPDCGGWLDLKGRCPECTELDWQRQQIRADLSRLIKERNDVLRDMERLRERLPIIRRQLADVEGDIEELRRKGVKPD